MSIWSNVKNGDACTDWQPEADKIHDAWDISSAWSWTNSIRLTLDDGTNEAQVVLTPAQTAALVFALSDVLLEQKRRSA